MAENTRSTRSGRKRQIVGNSGSRDGAGESEGEEVQFEIPNTDIRENVRNGLIDKMPYSLGQSSADTLAERLKYLEIQREMEREKWERERELEAREKEREREQREFEARERERERQHEIEMMERQAQLMLANREARRENQDEGERPNRGQSRSQNGEIAYWHEILKKMVPDCDRHDVDLTAFFQKLEGLFRSYEVPEEYHGRLLMPLLKSRIESLLTETQNLNDYDQLKSLVLKANRLTPTENRKRFLGARKMPNESFIQFAGRLKSLWKYYIESRNASSADEINELVVMDQFKNTLDPETATYVELQGGARDGHKLADLAELAETYEEKNRACRMDGRRRYPNGSEPHFSYIGRYRTLPDKGPRNEARIQSDRRGPDHQGSLPNSYDRRTRGRIMGVDERNGVRGAEMSNRGRAVTQTGCYICGGNHFARACDRRAQTRSTGDRAARHVAVENSNLTEALNNTDQVVAKISLHALTTERNGFLERGNAVDIQGKKLPMVKIKVGNGDPIEAIVDSGSEITVLNSKWVLEAQAEKRGTVRLRPAFGQAVKADLVEVPLSLTEDGKESVQPNVNILTAVTSLLNGDALLTPHDYELLSEQAGKYLGRDDIGSDPQNELGEVNREECRNPTDDGTDPYGLFELFDEDNEERDALCASAEGMLTSEDNENSHRISEPSKFKEEQRKCQELNGAWESLKKGKANFFCVDGILYHRENIQGIEVKQLVLPKLRRQSVMSLAHDSAFGGHLGMRKTLDRIRQSFYWEGMRRDVTAFCDSCEHCQRRRPIRTAERIPIEPVARPDLPFQVVNVDIIGPINPPSRGYKYLLILVDQHTHWVEAKPLRNISAQSTCEALLQIFMYTGVPSRIASDCGTNFTSALTKELEKRIGVSPRFSTPGRPQSNGLVERFNAVIKKMLHHVMREHPRDWDKQVPFVLWAYREVPCRTTGISPYRLLYGREARGPLSILKETWDGTIDDPNLGTESAHAYLRKLRERMEDAVKRAGIISTENQAKYVEYYNRRAKMRTFSEGDQVIALIPDSSNKMLAKWIGPIKVIKSYAPHSYLVEMPDSSRRHVHADKLRPFVARTNAIGVVFENDEEMGEIGTVPIGKDIRTERPKSQLSDEMLGHLSDERAEEVRRIADEFPELFSGKLRQVNMGEHTIRVKPGHEFKKPHLYRIPEALRDAVDRQVDELLEQGLIEPTESEYVHPLVCVEKRDGSIRLCCDFRALNSVSEADQFPMEQTTDLLYRIGNASFITVLDMNKAYWQIRMNPESRKYTGFATHRGLYAWRVMPFGLKGAGATFQRVINRALDPHRNYARAYIDDAAVFSSSWEEHVAHLRSVLRTLDGHGFSVNLAKSEIARSEVKYLGHIVGSGRHRPNPEKLRAIEGIERPVDKKGLRSFLGLCNYYRDYVENYASIALPLTELTKKRVPATIPWSDDAQRAFDHLKEALIRAPTLYTPDISREFQVFCDASDEAIAGCLSQRDETGRSCPVAFASRKLNPTQRKWSVGEREAYAVIFSLSKFEAWVYGSEKIEVYTDHNPLVMLSGSLPQSARLQRWALALQRFNVVVKYRKGSDNANADALSRLRNSQWENDHS